MATNAYAICACIGAIFTVIVDEWVKSRVRETHIEQTRWGLISNSFSSVLTELRAVRLHVVDLERQLAHHQPNHGKGAHKNGTHGGTAAAAPVAAAVGSSKAYSLSSHGAADTSERRPLLASTNDSSPASSIITVNSDSWRGGNGSQPPSNTSTIRSQIEGKERKGDVPDGVNGNGQGHGVGLALPSLLAHSNSLS